MNSASKRFCEDLESRRVAFEPPTDPLSDPDFIDLLSRTYRREPTTAA